MREQFFEQFVKTIQFKNVKRVACVVDYVAVVVAVKNVLFSESKRRDTEMDFKRVKQKQQFSVENQTQVNQTLSKNYKNDFMSSSGSNELVIPTPIFNKKAKNDAIKMEQDRSSAKRK